MLTNTMYSEPQRAVATPEITPARAGGSPRRAAGEGALVARVRRGDHAAFAELVRPHTAGLLRQLRGILADPAEAEDALQDSLLRAWVKLPTFRQPGAFGRWLRSIARNTALNALRARASRGRVRYLEEPPEAADERCPETQRIAAQKLERVERLFRQLSPAQQEVFLLRMRSELTFREIAARQGVPLNTALGRMHSARRRLSQG